MRFLKILILALALLAPVAVAHATKPSEATGNFTATTAITSMRTAGENTIFEAKATFTATGAFVGTCVGTTRGLIRPDGQELTHGSCTFTASMGEQPNAGTAVFKLESFGQGTSFHGHFVAGHGTGILAGLHAEGTFQGKATGATTSAGTYDGEMHFDPA